MRLVILAALVAAFMALGTSAAFAGEITGNGRIKEENNQRIGKTIERYQEILRPSIPSVRSPLSDA